MKREGKGDGVGGRDEQLIWHGRKETKLVGLRDSDVH